MILAPPWGKGFETEHAIIGRDFTLARDFTGALAPAAIGGGYGDHDFTISGATPTVGDDSANGGYGVLKLVGAATGSPWIMSTSKLALGSSAIDFSISFRMRLPNYPAGTDAVQVGLVPLPTAGAGSVTFGFTVAGIVAQYNNTTPYTSPIAVPVAAHTDFEIRRVSGVTYWMIGSQVVYSTPDAQTYTNCAIAAFNGSGSGSQLTLYLDRLKVWIGLSGGAGTVL